MRVDARIGSQCGKIKVKISINYQNGILNIPAAAANHVKTATRTDLSVLVLIASDPGAYSDLDSCVDELSERAGVGRDEFMASLSFWRGAGAITLDGELSDAERHNTPQKKLRPKSEMPMLTAEDVANITSSSPERLSLVSACQQTMGKMFNTSECSVILSVKEYLGVEDDYILTLAAYCVRRDKRSVKYLEKMALDLYGRDIDTTSALEEYLVWLETKDTFESKLRRLLGIGTRAFSKKEQECIERWLREYGYEYDMIEPAYSKTVDAIGKASVPYMDKILQSWYGKGYKSVADVEAGEGGGTANAETGNFDTDDFFRMAVKRGLDG